MIVSARNKQTWQIGPLRYGDGSYVEDLSSYPEILYQIKLRSTDTVPLVSAALSAGEIILDTPAVAWIQIMVSTTKTVALSAYINRNLYHAVKFIDSS